MCWLKADLFAGLAIRQQARAYAPAAVAASRRQVEFLAGRAAAQRALAILAPQHAAAVIDSGSLGEPLWPAGVVGSITHAAGYAGAAVAHARDYQGLGIDSEPVLAGGTADDVSPVICRPDEQHGFAGDRVALTVLFAAKESLYKCLAPLVRRSFDFQDAQLDAVDVAAGRFTIRLTRDLGPGYRVGWSVEGRFAHDGGLVHAGIALPAPGAPPVDTAWILRG